MKKVWKVEVSVGGKLMLEATVEGPDAGAVLYWMFVQGLLDGFMVVEGNSASVSVTEAEAA